MKGIDLVIFLTISLSISSFTIGSQFTFALQTDQCPPGQIPVYQNDKPVIDPVTGQPKCSPITGLDPLGNIFGR